MTHRKVNPVIVVPGVPGVPVRTLERLPRVHEAFDEKYLQDLLADHPELLPVHDIRDDVGSLLCIGRQVIVSSGAIDNLYLSTEGYPVIVETKLWRNPQARREVLSQTLDYIKEVVQKDFEWFAQQWARSSQQHGANASELLLTRLNELSDDEIEDKEFIDRVNRALSRGDVIAMIVGDGIETRLQELVDHLCKSSPHLRYSLALVELACYRLGQRDDDGILVVPRIVQDVEPVQRAYVRIDVTEELQKLIKVAPVSVTDSDEPSSLTEEDFLEAIERSVGRECRDQIKKFYAKFAESLELEFKKATLMLKVPHPDEDGLSASVLAIRKDGQIYNPKHLTKHLKSWGLNPEIVEQIASGYWTALHSIDSRFDLKGADQREKRKFVPFTEIADKLPEIEDQVRKVVAAIREAYDNAQLTNR